LVLVLVKTVLGALERQMKSQRMMSDLQALYAMDVEGAL
jgi:hypothetical protein